MWLPCGHTLNQWQWIIYFHRWEEKRATVCWVDCWVVPRGQLASNVKHLVCKEFTALLLGPPRTSPGPWSGLPKTSCSFVTVKNSNPCSQEMGMVVCIISVENEKRRGCGRVSWGLADPGTKVLEGGRHWQTGRQAAAPGGRSSRDPRDAIHWGATLQDLYDPCSDHKR